MCHSARFLLLVFPIVSFLTGCSLTGKGLEPGPSTAARISNHRNDGTPTDYPVSLPRLIELAVQTDPARPEPAKPVTGTALAQPATAVAPNAQDAADNFAGDEIELARKYFYANCSGDERCGVMRDRVQDRLIWASESACSDYLTSVRKSFTRTNLNLGAATTLFGTLGSLITSVNTARVFSGAGAFTSGLRAEYNDVYFSSQAFELVSKSIRSVREKTLKRIRDNRVGKNITQYTLDGAISDAMFYHGSCNVLAGLEEASDAVTRDRDPGLKRVSELLQNLNAGVNLSLGTAALDTSNLPSATNSCTTLAKVKKDSDTTAGDFDSKNKNLQADAATEDKVKKDSAALALKVAQMAVKIKDLAATQSANCDGKESAALKAESAMFDAIRQFFAVAADQKALEKQKFEITKKTVLELQVTIDAVIAKMRDQYNEMVYALK